jgi:valyl-tRNA synthetase
VNESVSLVLSHIRKVKSDAQVSMKAEISLAEITAPANVIAFIKLAETDLLAAGRIQKANWIEGSEISVSATIAPTE